MYIHETQVRVRYGETDQMGYMYYGNYASFYEVARVEMLRSLGLNYKSFESGGIMMPVLELHCKYIRPARYDDAIRIVTRLSDKPLARIRFDYELFNETGTLINVGHTILVFVNMSTLRPCAAPVQLQERLKEFFEDGMAS